MRFTVVFSGLAISEADPVKTSKRLSVQNPVRHQSGGYYAWIFADGKETWKSLKTDLLKVAQVKLREVSGPIGKTAHAGHADQRGNMTMEHCAAIFTNRIKDRFGLPGKRKMMRRIGESTQRYRKQTLTALGRSWPALLAKNVRRNTEREVGEWAEHFAAGSSATRYSPILDTLRALVQIAADAGARIDNPCITNWTRDGAARGTGAARSSVQCGQR